MSNPAADLRICEKGLTMPETDSGAFLGKQEALSTQALAQRTASPGCHGHVYGYLYMESTQ